MQSMINKLCLFIVLINFTLPVYSVIPLRVGTEDHPPYIYLKDNKYKGLSVELINRIFIKAGIPYLYETRP